jgi:hypothetical protein
MCLRLGARLPDDLQWGQAGQKLALASLMVWRRVVAVGKSRMSIFQTVA